MFDFPSLREIVLSLPPFLLALSFHEFAHALAADRMGDPTPRQNGRLTINPLAHLDVIGTIMLVLYKFGWAKPVPINPNNFKNYRVGSLITALAGPLSNFVLALISVFLYSIPSLSNAGVWSEMLFSFIIINLVLAAFNIIPIPPLDGSHILESLLPYKYAVMYEKYAVYGPILLILLIVSDAFNYVLYPIVNVLYGLIMFVVNIFM